MVCGSQQATEHSSTTEAFFLNNKEATVTINMASKQGDDPIKLLQKYFQKYSKQFQQLGFSGIVGVFSGYAFKRISKEIAFTIGGVFILLQGLSYCGYININYKKLENDVTNKLDQNGDGKLDLEDARVALNNANNLLAFGLPNASGFASGFATGLYFG